MPTQQDSPTKEVRIPTWIFEDIGAYFLLGIKPNGEIITDGGHSKPSGVTRAKVLRESITCIRPPEGTRFVMLRVEEVPQKNVKVNKSAIKQLNKAYDYTRR